jgi:hypothetical protein
MNLFLQSGWRAYAYYPRTSTLYEKDCLRDIAQFCETETANQQATSRAN